MQINLGCLCNIACAIISISFLTMCDSALEMFFCVSNRVLVLEPFFNLDTNIISRLQHTLILDNGNIW